MQVQPYVFFDGRCDEALEFYRKAVGAEVTMLMRFKDSPVPYDAGTGAPAPTGDKVMHASVRIGDSTILMSDGQSQNRPRFEGFALTLIVASEAEADRMFAALAEGGQIQMPLTKTFFSPRFGMLVDRFGVTWMIYVGA
jgi:PhnB protein